MTALALALTVVTLALAGAMAGFFYAYSMSVMWALDAVDPKAAIASMQSIYIVVRNAIFFPAFFGTPVVALPDSDKIADRASLLLFYREALRAAVASSAERLFQASSVPFSSSSIPQRLPPVFTHRAWSALALKSASMSR